ncbi:MAG TPA: LysR family transcriptional regulator [Gammaproteobacteria bacterium]|nr:LysR family transcriptional regulator [Gammaproteobacteria bacterium]
MTLNTLQNIKAFILVARVASFSAAARELGVAPSVITKRITSLERHMGEKLFQRSTRGLKLTEAGERILPRYQRLVTELEDIIQNNRSAHKGSNGHLRIKAPTTVTTRYLGRLFCEFQAEHPGVSLEIAVVDRSVNPMDENFDLVIAAAPTSYANVVDIPLTPYPLVLCAAPDYLARKGRPLQPRDLVDHDCLTSILLGQSWTFEGPRGPLTVEIHSKLHVNEATVLLEATLLGTGVAVLPRFVAETNLQRGRLASLLEEFPLRRLWLKALVPNVKMHKPLINDLVQFLQSRMQSIPPWERESQPS